MAARQRRGSMHPLRKLLWDELDRKKWLPADLARASGLSPQVVSTLLNDERDYLDQMPKRDTLSKIAYGFRIPEGLVLRAAAEAWGVPLDTSDARLTADDLSNEELLATMARRLGVVGTAVTRPELRAAHDPGRGERRR